MRKLDMNERIVNGRWTQIGQRFTSDGVHSVAVFQCECGNRVVVNYASVKSGRSRSCGCLRDERTREARRTHGQTSNNSVTGTYTSWAGIIQRCCNKNNRAYHDYGGRGITVCDQWKESFKNFLSDMGERPEGMSIDRVDNNGNYEPGNCRWATCIEQGRNTRRNLLVTYNGVTKCLSEWAIEYGILYATLQQRISRGLSIEKALTTQVKNKPADSPQQLTES